MKKGMVAPIIITIILVLLLCGYFVAWIIIPIPVIAKLIGLVVFFALIGVSIYVLLERLNEIERGEEDDLSKY